MIVSKFRKLKNTNEEEQRAAGEDVGGWQVRAQAQQEEEWEPRKRALDWSRFKCTSSLNRAGAETVIFKSATGIQVSQM